MWVHRLWLGPCVVQQLFLNATILKVSSCITWDPGLRIVQSTVHFIPWQTHSVEPNCDLGLWEEFNHAEINAHCYSYTDICHCL